MRLPITAEDALEPHHFDEIASLIMGYPTDKVHIIFNCQMGASRSTSCAVIALIVERWRKGQPRSLHASRPGTPKEMMERRPHYRLIHSILRVVGSECKYIVDCILEEVSAVVNLRSSIEQYRKIAGDASDPNNIRRTLRKGVIALKRYAMLILFQGYLNSQPPPSLDSVGMLTFETFVQWLERHQEFTVLLNDLDCNNSLDILGEEALVAPKQLLTVATEVWDFVEHRKGHVLAPMTILKFDHFPGCQKTSLPERIEGAPKFREIEFDGHYSVFGLAMPTQQGFSNVLHRIGRPVLWICLREEPVIYIQR